MSFGVQHVPSGIEYAGSSLSQLFAQRRNLFNPRFLRALQHIGRFNSEAHAALAGHAFDRMTLEEYADARGYGHDFLSLYLLPMSSAVWSTPFEDVRQFPVMTLLRFFRNHGLLGGLSGQHQWKSVTGGAKTYVEKMTRGFRDGIHLGNAVVGVERSPAEAVIHFADRSSRRFDKVIFACHADEALAMLAQPSADERRLLGAFRYQKNVAVLHTDPAPMPRLRRAWASWNCRLDTRPDGRVAATTIYWMNSLQNVSDRRDYFVSIDDPGLVDSARVLKTITYHHPVFTLAAIDAQNELPALNRIDPGQTSYFCGSYFRYGFHEDAFTSAIQASRAVSAGLGVDLDVDEAAA
jgi:predicted NAD/FAD-binding protein